MLNQFLYENSFAQIFENVIRRNLNCSFRWDYSQNILRRWSDQLAFSSGTPFLKVVYSTKQILSNDKILLIPSTDSPWSRVYMVKKSRLCLLSFSGKWKFTKNFCDAKYSENNLPHDTCNVYIYRTAKPFELKFSVSS